MWGGETLADLVELVVKFKRYHAHDKSAYQKRVCAAQAQKDQVIELAMDVHKLHTLVLGSINYPFVQKAGPETHDLRLGSGQPMSRQASTIWWVWSLSLAQSDVLWSQL